MWIAIALYRVICHNEILPQFTTSLLKVFHKQSGTAPSIDIQ